MRADIVGSWAFACSRPNKVTADRVEISNQFRSFNTESAFKQRRSENPDAGADGTRYRLGSPQARSRLENNSRSRR